MAKATQESFSEIFTIELSEQLAKKARLRLAGQNNTTVIQGDSPNIIPKILNEIDKDKSIVFWLDAHYSGGSTSKSKIFEETPIEKELENICSNWIDGSIILIDDARNFTGVGGYPCVDKLRKVIKEKLGPIEVNIEGDIIQIKKL